MGKALVAPTFLGPFSLVEGDEDCNILSSTKGLGSRNLLIHSISLLLCLYSAVLFVFAGSSVCNIDQFSFFSGFPSFPLLLFLLALTYYPWVCFSRGDD